MTRLQQLLDLIFHVYCKADTLLIGYNLATTGRGLLLALATPGLLRFLGHRADVTRGSLAELHYITAGSKMRCRALAMGIAMTRMRAGSTEGRERVGVRRASHTHTDAAGAIRAAPHCFSIAASPPGGIAMMQFIAQVFSLLAFIAYSALVGVLYLPWFLIHNLAISLQGLLSSSSASDRQVKRQPQDGTVAFYEGYVSHIRRKPKVNTFK